MMEYKKGEMNKEELRKIKIEISLAELGWRHPILLWVSCAFIPCALLYNVIFEKNPKRMY